MSDIRLMIYLGVLRETQVKADNIIAFFCPARNYKQIPNDHRL